MRCFADLVLLLWVAGAMTGFFAIPHPLVTSNAMLPLAPGLRSSCHEPMTGRLLVSSGMPLPDVELCVENDRPDTQNSDV